MSAVYIDGGRGRGQAHHFPGVGEGREADRSELLSLPGSLSLHHRSEAGPWTLVHSVEGELSLESRDRSCIEKQQLSFPNHTIHPTALSVEKQIAIPVRQGPRASGEVDTLVQKSDRQRCSAASMRNSPRSGIWRRSHRRSHAGLKGLQSNRESQWKMT